jgi:hypothetical protein
MFVRALAINYRFIAAAPHLRLFFSNLSNEITTFLKLAASRWDMARWLGDILTCRDICVPGLLSSLHTFTESG